METLAVIEEESYLIIIINKHVHFVPNAEIGNTEN